MPDLRGALISGDHACLVEGSYEVPYNCNVPANGA